MPQATPLLDFRQTLANSNRRGARKFAEGIGEKRFLKPQRSIDAVERSAIAEQRPMREVAMDGAATVLSLEQQGKLVDPAVLAANLSAVDGEAVAIDAIGTPILTSLHLQVILSAKERWNAQGLSFELVNTSDQFKSCMALLGWRPTPDMSEE